LAVEAVEAAEAMGTEEAAANFAAGLSAYR